MIVDWDAFDTNSSIILTLVFFLLKDVVPCIKTLLFHYLRKTIHVELLKDLGRELINAIIYFPCEIIELSIGFLLGQVVLSSKAASIAATSDVREAVVSALTVNTSLFYVSLLIIFPVWAFVTKLCDSMILDKERKTIEHILGVVIYVLLWILTVLFLMFSLK